MGPHLRRAGYSVLGLLVVVSFQNCGKGFQSVHAGIAASAQCRAQMKAEVTANRLPATEMRCWDFNNFACERRVFSPDVENFSHSLKECLPGDQTCVDVDVLQFNTLAARLGSRPQQFEPGGDYNREEIRCYHRIRIKGTVVFEGEGDSLAEALAGAVKACEAAVEGT